MKESLIFVTTEQNKHRRTMLMMIFGVLVTLTMVRDAFIIISIEPLDNEGGFVKNSLAKGIIPGGARVSPKLVSNKLGSSGVHRGALPLG